MREIEDSFVSLKDEDENSSETPKIIEGTRKTIELSQEKDDAISPMHADKERIELQRNPQLSVMV